MTKKLTQFSVFIFSLLCIVLFSISLSHAAPNDPSGPVETPKDSTDSTLNSAQNVLGWAWGAENNEGSSGVGWISFSSENNVSNDTSVGGGRHTIALSENIVSKAHAQNSTATYGVSMESNTGDMSGYSWSSNYGWISFNPESVSGCPGTGSCAPRLDIANGELRGWARYCSVFVSGCSGALKSQNQRGTWEGWISLSCKDTSCTERVAKNTNTENSKIFAFLSSKVLKIKNFFNTIVPYVNAQTSQGKSEVGQDPGSDENVSSQMVGNYGIYLNTSNSSEQKLEGFAWSGHAGSIMDGWIEFSDVIVELGDPALSLSAEPLVATGPSYEVKLLWKSDNENNFSSCTASAEDVSGNPLAIDDWNGSLSASQIPNNTNGYGPFEMSNIVVPRDPTIFKLSCMEAGTTVESRVQVDYSEENSDVLLSAISPVYSGQNTELSWQISPLVNSCEFSVIPSAPKPGTVTSSGSESVGPLSAISSNKTYTYTITCQTDNGEASSSTMVNVLQSSISLSGDSCVLNSGDIARLSWNEIPNGSSVSGCDTNWGGSVPSSGTAQIPVNSTKDYYINCDDGIDSNVHTIEVTSQCSGSGTTPGDNFRYIER
ncbi:MAG: hypothetical protein ACI9AR_000091 [Flavobacteriaceae bacterium]|jgi:hypothetical protein